jgi:hypothetical protein
MSASAAKEDRSMARRKRHSPDEIVAKLRQVEVRTGQGTPVADAIRAIGATEASSGTSCSTSRSSVAGFAAVAIAPTTTVTPVGGTAPPGLIEIELAGGDRVRISGAADPAVVAAALRALAGR